MLQRWRALQHMRDFSTCHDSCACNTITCDNFYPYKTDVPSFKIEELLEFKELGVYYVSGAVIPYTREAEEVCKFADAIDLNGKLGGVVKTRRTTLFFPEAAAAAALSVFRGDSLKAFSGHVMGEGESAHAVCAFSDVAAIYITSFDKLTDLKSSSSFHQYIVRREALPEQFTMAPPAQHKARLNFLLAYTNSAIFFANSSDNSFSLHSFSPNARQPAMIYRARETAQMAFVRTESQGKKRVAALIQFKTKTQIVILKNDERKKRKTREYAVAGLFDSDLSRVVDIVAGLRTVSGRNAWAAVLRADDNLPAQLITLTLCSDDVYRVRTRQNIDASANSIAVDGIALVIGYPARGIVQFMSYSAETNNFIVTATSQSVIGHGRALSKVQSDVPQPYKAKILSSISTNLKESPFVQAFDLSKLNVDIEVTGKFG